MLLILLVQLKKQTKLVNSIAVCYTGTNHNCKSWSELLKMRRDEAKSTNSHDLFVLSAKLSSFAVHWLRKHFQRLSRIISKSGKKTRFYRFLNLLIENSNLLVICTFQFKTRIWLIFRICFGESKVESVGGSCALQAIDPGSVPGHRSLFKLLIVMFWNVVCNNFFFSIKQIWYFLRYFVYIRNLVLPATTY